MIRNKALKFLKEEFWDAISNRAKRQDMYRGGITTALIFTAGVTTGYFGKDDPFTPTNNVPAKSDDTLIFTVHPTKASGNSPSIILGNMTAIGLAENGHPTYGYKDPVSGAEIAARKVAKDGNEKTIAHTQPDVLAYLSRYVPDVGNALHEATKINFPECGVPVSKKYNDIDEIKDAIKGLKKGQKFKIGVPEKGSGSYITLINNLQSIFTVEELAKINVIEYGKITDDKGKIRDMFNDLNSDKIDMSYFVEMLGEFDGKLRGKQARLESEDLMIVNMDKDNFKNLGDYGYNLYDVSFSFEVNDKHDDIGLVCNPHVSVVTRNYNGIDDEDLARDVKTLQRSLNQIDYGTIKGYEQFPHKLIKQGSSPSPSIGS